KEYDPIHILHSPEVVVSKPIKDERPRGQLHLGGDSESVDIELQIKLPKDSKLARALAEDNDK
ncbi:MAG: hypothetical protein ACKO2M_05830, partial [Actinomycetota bacterium]